MRTIYVEDVWQNFEDCLLLESKGWRWNALLFEPSTCKFMNEYVKPIVK